MRGLAPYLLAAAGAALAAAPAHALDRPAADIRVIIDVSGSMKKNDPENLRASAVQLFVNLLPDGVRAGVWTFGKHVNMQVGLGAVDAPWRGEAERAAARIHSRGLFTDIEAALDTVASDWFGRPVDAPRHLILLTDGVVDVSKDASRSEASRARILSDVRPRLVDAGISVHALALSEHADAELLEHLAHATGGTFVPVGEATALERLFLRLVEHSAKPDTVPIEDGGFVVDASVDEMTVLVFRGAGERETRLLSPDGRFFEATMVDERVRWRRHGGYELITVREPSPGRWRLDGADDPDNRVAVVTDLRMQLSDSPGRLLPEQALTLEMSLSQGDAVLTEAGLLDLVEWSVERVSESRLATLERVAEGLPAPHDDGVAPDARADDGRFSVTVTPNGVEGLTELVVTADSGTFKRQTRRLVTVQWPVAMDRTVTPEGAEWFVLEARPQAMQPESLSVTARWSAPGAPALALEATRDETGHWRVERPVADAVGEHRLEITVTGRSDAGDTFSHLLPPIAYPGLPAPEPPPEPVPAIESAAGPAADPAPPSGALLAVDRDAPPDWILAGSVAAAIGLLFTGLPVLLRRLRARRQRTLVNRFPVDGPTPAPA